MDGKRRARSGGGAKGEVPGQCAHWLMRTNELVKACLGAPFCTLAEVLILSRIKPFAPRSGTKRYTWLADAFNTYVPHMRSQGHQVCFKMPKHVEAFETDTESASLGYVDTVKCLGAIGQNFSRPSDAWKR